MRRRTLFSTAGVTAAGLVTAAVVVAGQQPATASPSGELVLKEKFTGLSTLDTGKTGTSIGDHLAFRTKVSKDGEKIGVAGGDCVVISGDTETNALYSCSQTYRLPGGTLLVGGAFTFAKKVNWWAILGGTGKYRGASGEVSFTTLSEDSFKDVFKFD